MRWIARNVVVGVLTSTVAMSVTATWEQTELEEILCYGCEPRDYFPEGEPPYIPRRYRNSLPEFQGFISTAGWTTNQFVEGLICAITNNVKPENWSDALKKRTAKRATWKLSEIDSPAVTNFFRWFNDEYNIDGYKVNSITPIFWRTNLEPEVMSYMRSLCVRTNIYCKAEYNVMRDMFETLSTMPDELKPAATNRVAQYMYFAIGHVTDSQGWQDIELSRFVPAYSNSVQRLSLMRYVSTSATNDWERANAAQIVQRLESMPTNQLNDVSWIAE
jgi:hypothetical protein